MSLAGRWMRRVRESALSSRSTDGKAAVKIVPPRPRIPYWKGLGADSEEKREPERDIDTAVVDSLKVLDPTGRLEKRARIYSQPLPASWVSQGAVSLHPPPGLVVPSFFVV